jgi:hypothetical protein
LRPWDDDDDEEEDDDHGYHQWQSVWKMLWVKGTRTGVVWMFLTKYTSTG